MKKQICILLGLILFTASCKKENNNELVPASSKVSNTNINTAAKKAGKSFSGTLTFQFSSTHNLPCNCGSFTAIGTLYGTGNLPHLGNSSSLIKPCVSPIINNGVYVGDHVGIECAIITAANGDELHCYTYPYDLLFGPSGPSGTVIVDFVGGTGRFNNASGSFTGTININAQQVATLTITSGTIHY